MLFELNNLIIYLVFEIFIMLKFIDLFITGAVPADAEAVHSGQPGFEERPHRVAEGAAGDQQVAHDEGGQASGQDREEA